MAVAYLHERMGKPNHQQHPHPALCCHTCCLPPLPPPSRLLAESCWAGDPTLRPSATILVHRLKELHEESCSRRAATARPARQDGLVSLERGLRAF